MKNKVIDPILFADFLRTYYQSKSNRGILVERFADLTGFEKTTIYSKIRKAKLGVSITEAAGKKKSRAPKETPEQREQRRKETIIVAGLKFAEAKSAKYNTRTEDAVRKAKALNQITLDVSESTWNRWMTEFGLSLKERRRPWAVRSLTASYPMHVMMADASPMNHYYMKLNKEIQPVDVIPGDTHHEEKMLSAGLYKIWVYYLVDMYSKAFIAIPFAPEPKGKDARMGGENFDDWLTALMFAMLPKHNLPKLRTSDGILRTKHPFEGSPLEGLPTILYTDLGSGIGGNNTMKRIFQRLGHGSRILTHEAGKPNSKGLVESRIGAVKRSFESSLLRHTIKTLDDLRYYYAAWSDYQNRKKGFYDKFLEGAKNRKIIRVSKENFQDAMVTHTMRSVGGFGQIQIDGFNYYVNEALAQKKVYVFKAAGDEPRFVAEDEDGNIYQCERLEGDGKRHNFDEPRSFKADPRIDNIKEAIVKGKALNKMLSFEDILPPSEDKLIYFPQATDQLQTSSHFTPKEFHSIESAKKFIFMRTGLNEHLSPRNILELVGTTLNAAYHNGVIKDSVVDTIIGIISDHQTKTQHINKEAGNV